MSEPDTPLPCDVFIVFSKSAPFEAKFALAVKHGLEELGRFAHEYEDWSWVEQGNVADGDAVDVDRAVLRAMLLTCSAVLVIPPRTDTPTDGVAIERELLASLQIPVLLLRWALTDEESDRNDLNVIYHYQVHGTEPNDRWISSAGKQIAELLWLACTVAELRNSHVPIGSLVLDQLSAHGNAPLTSFKLRDGLVGEDDYLREPDLDALADSVVAAATRDQWTALIEQWWAEADPALAFLKVGGHGPVRRPCNELHAAMDAVVRRARQRFPQLQSFSADALRRRGIAFTRYERFDEAVGVLTEALARADEFHDRIYGARALAYDARGDLDAALADLDAAVQCAAGTVEESTHRFTRAVFQAKRKTPEAYRAAIADYTHVLESNPAVRMRIDALNYRAINFAKIRDVAAAVADWTAVVEHQADRPRAAAQARFNRGVQLQRLGDLAAAREDYTGVLAWADVSSSQRFRALEARAAVLEGLGEFSAAADDIDAMLVMDLADPESRPELKERARSLRNAAAGDARSR